MQSPVARDRGLVAEEQQKAGRIEVPYTAFEGTARRVIIPVQINGAITANMALDTGSPGMVIFDRLARRLGLLERDDGRLLTYSAGIGGTAPSVLTIVDTVQVATARDRFIPTVVTQSLTDAFDGLIGMDFMANYSLRIDTARQIVVFEELPARPEMPGGHDELWWRTTFRNFAAMRTEWKLFHESLPKAISQTDPKTYEQLKRFAERQYREADKLFSKLNSYAVTNSVPMHWRQY